MYGTAAIIFRHFGENEQPKQRRTILITYCQDFRFRIPIRYPLHYGITLLFYMKQFGQVLHHISRQDRREFLYQHFSR